MKQAFAAAFVVTAFFSLAALADGNHGEKDHGAQRASAQSGAMSEGEVRKVDMKFEAQKVGGGFAVAKIEPAK